MTALAPPPPAPASPPPAVSPGGRTAVRVALIAVATVLVVGTVASLSVMAWGISRLRVITDSAALPTAMRSLVVDVGSVPMSIRITTDRRAREPRAELWMVNSMQADANPLQLDANRVDTRLTITGEATAFLPWNRAGEVTVVLPPDLSRRLTVTTEQRAGGVIADADLDELVAHTGNDAVALKGSFRRIEIENLNGKVATPEPVSVSESFSATTVTSDIKVDFAQTAPRTVEASSQEGDVLIGLPGRGPYFVNVDTGSKHGTTVVKVPRTANREDAAAVITARSQRGDVVIDGLR